MLPNSAGPSLVFAALGDATRLQLISRLSDGKSHSISQLADGLSQSRQGITKHLRVLENAGIVISSRVGRESKFRFEPRAIRSAGTYLDTVSEQWDSALARLQSYVED